MLLLYSSMMSVITFNLAMSNSRDAQWKTHNNTENSTTELGEYKNIQRDWGILLPSCVNIIGEENVITKTISSSTMVDSVWFALMLLGMSYMYFISMLWIQC